MLTGSQLWFLKIIPEAARDKIILAHFHAANESSAPENIDQLREGNSAEGLSKHLIVNNCIYKGSESFRKTLKTISAYTEVLIKMLDLQKIQYQSRDTVPSRVLEQVWSLQWLWAPSPCKNGILPHYQTQFFFRDQCRARTIMEQVTVKKATLIFCGLNWLHPPPPPPPDPAAS
jgi:hypothetical protein